MKCGVGDYTYNLALRLSQQKGMKVVVITTTGAQGYSKDDSFRIEPLVDTWNFKSLMQLKRFARAWKPDAVHIQYPTQGYRRSMIPSFLPLVFRLLKIPIIQTWHEPMSRKGWFRYLPNTLTTDMLIVVEPDYKLHLPFLYRWLIHHKRFEVVPVASAIPMVELTHEEKNRIRAQFDASQKNLVAYFGFLSHKKGVDQIFRILDPEKDRLVLVCDLAYENDYHKVISACMNTSPWAGRSYVTGFLDAQEVARILATADVVVLPFIDGLNMRNTSFLAAREQGTFIVTTHKHLRGYTPDENVYYVSPSNLNEMKLAIRRYLGTKKSPGAEKMANWDAIVNRHMEIYSMVLSN